MFFCQKAKLKPKKIKGCALGGFQSPQNEKKIAKVFIFGYLVFSV
jgi:hypothetical protein